MGGGQLEVAAQGIGKQVHPLAHHREGGAQRPFAVVGERLAIEQDLAGLRVPFASQQSHQSGLATAGLAQQRQLFAGLQLQGAAAQHRLRVARVAEIEVAYLQRTLLRVALFVAPLGGLGLLQDLVEAAGRG